MLHKHDAGHGQQSSALAGGKQDFSDGDMGILSTGGGMIDAGSRRLGANEGRIGGAGGDKTRRRQTTQNRLQVFYHVLIGSERTPRGGHAHVEGKQPKI